MGSKLRTRAKRTLGFLVFLIVLVVGVVAFMHRQDIQDHFRASGFDPSPRTVEVMHELDLTTTGERVFLASQPTIDGSQLFNEQCADVDHSEQGHVLGCFTGDRIHLFDVPDERVNGIVEVTAAHEVLHAAYSRMSDDERAVLAERLMTEFDTLSADNPELAERMAVYDHLSEAAFANELHSVLGTEVQNLPEWLEEHYAEWFVNRGALVDHFDAYHSVFIELRDQADAIDAEMTALRADVEQRNADYDDAVQQFNADAASFRKRNENFEFSADPSEFERIRDELEVRRTDLQTTLETLQADIDHYNSLRDNLTELSQLSSELEQKLNSDLAPVTTRPDA